jgi:hypothetical protein
VNPHEFAEAYLGALSRADLAPGGQMQDLMIESSGLSRAAFLSLVSANLSS